MSGTHVCLTFVDKIHFIIVPDKDTAHSDTLAELNSHRHLETKEEVRTVTLKMWSQEEEKLK